MSRLPIPNQKAFKKRAEWLQTARPKQIPDNSDWLTWLLLAGRGFGKTRCAAEDVWWYSWTHPKIIHGVIGATNDTVRDICFEGESGLLNVMPPEIIADSTLKPLKIELINGSKIRGFSADKYERLRGRNFHRVWQDELASWSYMQEAFDQIELCLRLGDDTRKIITTTPKPYKLIKETLADKSTKVTTGSTYDNEENLSKNFFKTIRDKYEGTTLGRQELYAEILDDVKGALWTRTLIDDCYKPNVEDTSPRIVIAIDPAVTANKKSDETGIVVVSKNIDQIRQSTPFSVLEDASGTYKPDEWANKALYLYETLGAYAIVAEVNQGGDMVSTIIKSKNPYANVIQVRATKGKYTRAEPIAALYEQGKVIHKKRFTKLEDQMATWTPDSPDSPDRLDALVWGLSLLSQNISEPRITRL